MIHQLTIIIFIISCWNILNAITDLLSDNCYDVIDRFYSGLYNVMLALVTGSYL